VHDSTTFFDGYTSYEQATFVAPGGSDTADHILDVRSAADVSRPGRTRRPALRYIDDSGSFRIFGTSLSLDASPGVGWRNLAAAVSPEPTCAGHNPLAPRAIAA
jgi:hypothetical protein